MPSSGSAPAGLKKVLAILGAFSAGNEPLAIGPLMGRLGIARSSGYRIINTLLGRGYLEQPKRGWIRLGKKIDALSDAYRKQRLLSLNQNGRVRSKRSQASRREKKLRDSRENLVSAALASRGYPRRPAPYCIGFSNASTLNPWRVAMLQGMLDFVRNHPQGIERFIVRNAYDDPERQAQDIEALLHERLDLLLVSCNPSASVAAALSKVADAGVPVVAVDRRPIDDKHFLAHVSASDSMIGHLTARWIVERLQGKGTVCMMGGVAGSSPAEHRMTAALEVFKQHPEIVVSDVVYTDWLHQSGYKAAMGIARKEIPDAVWCDGGLQGVGSMRAFLELGSRDKIPLHTGGEVNGIFQLAVRHKVPLAAVEYPAWVGIRALQAALDLLAGRPLCRHIEVPSQIIVSRDAETASVRAHRFVENHVRWDRPADFVASHGQGDRYAPDRFGAFIHKPAIEICA